MVRENNNRCSINFNTFTCNNNNNNNNSSPHKGRRRVKEHLPSDRTHILELKLNSQACFLLLHLKLFLLRMYGLKEDKIAEYTPSEAAAVYEKACSRRNIRCFAPDFVINELATAGEQQRNADDWAERRRIAEDFHKFHEMLLSLDERRDDDEDEAAVGVVAVVPPFPCAATITATVGDQQHQQLQQ
uniref:Nipped-B protein n=1 Tax=Globodera rostochiensis TaxID=31243 RepID=A0A914HIV3_GLORO